jgi:hypothetical protein
VGGRDDLAHADVPLNARPEDLDDELTQVIHAALGLVLERCDPVELDRSGTVTLTRTRRVPEEGGVERVPGLLDVAQCPP